MNRAIIFATGKNSHLTPLSPHTPGPLLPILDKPLLEHIIDFLAANQCQELSIILYEKPHEIEKQIGNGSRWGLKITYHLSKDPNNALSAIQPTMEKWNDPFLIVAKANCLPDFSFHKWLQYHEKTKSPTHLFFPSKKWSGWGIFKREDLIKLNPNTSLEHLISNLPQANYEILKAKPFFSTDSLKDLQATNLKLLNAPVDPQFFPTTTKMVEPGIWLARGVVLHPTAEIRPPVFIGAESHINPYSCIGPYAVIGNQCIIDKGASIDHSLITKRSYVGEGLEVHNAIVNEHRLINLSLNTSISVQDPMLLSKLENPSFKKFLLKSLGRVFALSLLIFFSPLFLLLMLIYRFEKKEVVALPARRNKEQWQTFSLLSFGKGQGFIGCLPMLFNILRGELHFTGVPPRTKEETAKLPKEWREIYLTSKVGLITLEMVEHNHPPKDIQCISEAYFTANQGLGYDLTLCLRWIWKKFKNSLFKEEF